MASPLGELSPTTATVDAASEPLHLQRAEVERAAESKTLYARQGSSITAGAPRAGLMQIPRVQAFCRQPMTASEQSLQHGGHQPTHQPTNQPSQHHESGAADTTSTAVAEIPRSLKALLAEVHGVAAANAELVEMRTEHRQMTLAESPFTRTATSATPAARESTAKRAMTLLKICKAELADYSIRPRQSESDARSGAATTAAEAAAALRE